MTWPTPERRCASPATSARRRGPLRRRLPEAAVGGRLRIRLAPHRSLDRLSLHALGGLSDRPVDPAHQVAQLLARHLDGMLGVLLAQALAFLVAALHVGDELLDEGAVLDLG